MIYTRSPCSRTWHYTCWFVIDVPKNDLIHADVLLITRVKIKDFVRNKKKNEWRLIMWSLSCYMKSIESLVVVLNMQGAWNSSNTASTMVQGQAYCIITFYHSIHHGARSGLLYYSLLSQHPPWCKVMLTVLKPDMPNHWLLGGKYSLS